MSRRDNSGALFRNDRKETDSHPDYKGQASIDGDEYWMDAWINQSEAGKKYMAVKFKPKESRQERPEPRQKSRRAADDDVPW